MEVGTHVEPEASEVPKLVDGDLVEKFPAAKQMMKTLHVD
jgi:hypothetical protein